MDEDDGKDDDFDGSLGIWNEPFFAVYQIHMRCKNATFFQYIIYGVFSNLLTVAKEYEGQFP
jgi:hypothetical protein